MPLQNRSRFAERRRPEIQDLALDAGEKILGSPRVEDPSPVEEEQPIEPLGLVEIGGADDGADSASDHLVHHEPQVAARDRVHSERGLVQEEEPGLVDEGAGEPELLLHPPGELPREPVGERLQARELEEPLEPRRPLRPGNLVEIGIEAQVLEHRQVGVEPEALRHVGNLRLDALGIPDDAGSEDLGLSRRRTKHPREHPEKRRLSGAVRPHEAEELSRHGFERDAVDRGLTAERLREARDANRGRHRDSASRRTSAGIPGFRSPDGSEVIRTSTA